MTPLLPSVSSSSLVAAAQRLLREGALDRADRALHAALAIAPTDPEALHLLGLAALQRGRHAAAALSFGWAIMAEPGVAKAHANRSSALRLLDRKAEALVACERALALDPSLAALHMNIATLLRDLGRSGGMIDAFRRLLRLAPGSAQGLHGLVDALRTANRLDEAILAGRRLAALCPDAAQAHGNLGVMLQFQSRLEEAKGCYARALAIDPGYAEARSNLGLLQLLTGDLAAGWVNHAARWATRDKASSLRSFPLPAWDGEPLPGRRLLAWGELGVGDEILLAGMIPDLAAMGVGCVLETAPRLVPLFARSFPEVEVAPRLDPPHPATEAGDLGAQSSLGNLGRWLRPDFASFPRRQSYLTADPARVAELRARYQAGRAGDRLVGISWRSVNPGHRDYKSAPLPLWSPLLRVPGVTFVDLQYGDFVADVEEARRMTGAAVIHDDSVDPLTDLDGFAAQVAALDLVISISNTTVHVAGALGVPVWMLLARQTGFLWCWFTEREDSPWYPSMRLFRQKTAGDWTPVFARIRDELERTVAAGQPRAGI
jgi:tetratricopeptide (TPR) repeat protein